MATQNDTADGNDAFVSLGVLDRLVGYHLRRAYGALRTDFNREMDGLGMRQVQFAILSIIDANPGVSQGAIGRMLAIHPANMVSLINELIDRELIDRQPSRNDRRAGELSLTRTGRTLLKESLARIEHHEERLLSRLSSNDRKRLLELLRKVVD